MKVIVLFLIFVSSITYSQTVYQVEPGMKGNKIILTIENASTSLGIDGVKINEENNSEFIRLKKNEYELTNIEKNSEKEIEIEFDVLTNALINTRDTLSFKITDKDGKSWKKNIVLEYTPPKEYALYQNYPNPFNPTTTIKYSIPRRGGQANVERDLSRFNGSELKSALQVQLKVYDILGREVATLVNKVQRPGNYEITFDATSANQRISSGIYFYKLQAGNFKEVRKMLLLK